MRCCRRTRGPELDVDALRIEVPAPAVDLPFDVAAGQIIPRVSSPHPARDTNSPVRLVSIRAGATPAGHVLSTGLAAGVHSGITGVDFFVPDPLLERLWARDAFTARLPQRLGADFMVAPDFSVYWDDPRLEQELALARSLSVCDTWSVAQVPTVPIITWARDEHRELVSEFVRGGNYSTVAFNAQLIKPSERDRVLREAGELLESAGCVRSVIVCGGSTEASRQAYLDGFGVDVAFATAKWMFDPEVVL